MSATAAELQARVDVELARHRPFAVQLDCGEACIACQACLDIGEDYHPVGDYEDDGVLNLVAVAWPCQTYKNLAPERTNHA